MHLPWRSYSLVLEKKSSYKGEDKDRKHKGGIISSKRRVLGRDNVWIKLTLSLGDTQVKKVDKLFHFHPWWIWDTCGIFKCACSLECQHYRQGMYIWMLPAYDGSCQHTYGSCSHEECVLWEESKNWILKNTNDKMTDRRRRSCKGIE